MTFLEVMSVVERVVPEVEVFSYVSSKAGADPVRTVFLLAPDSEAATLEGVRRFAADSGWLDQVEESGDLLVAPVVPQGWAAEPGDLLLDVYQARARGFRAPSGETIPGRDGVVWAWECLVCLVGYEEGAVFAGNLVVAHPSFAAATVLVDGAPTDYSAARRPSEHRFVRDPSCGSLLLNHDVPVAVWLMGDAGDDGEAERFFSASATEPWQVRTIPGLSGTTPDIAEEAMGGPLSHVVRWKASPDGRLAWHMSRSEFYEGARFSHDHVRVGGIDYPYAVHLPEGMTRSDAAGLAVVVQLHGRGEPAWLFSDKNGWEDLADETREFMVVTPDSPGNIWIYERDVDVLESLVQRVVLEYSADAARVYAAGFSNGAIFALQEASSRPWLLAAASAWNSPGTKACRESGLGPFVVDPTLVSSGYEMPLWLSAGDADEKAPADFGDVLSVALPANGCSPKGVPMSVNRCVPGLVEADRLSTTAYADERGGVRVCTTVVRDLPHGAIADEARAAWDFMRGFRRASGSRAVTEAT